MLIDSSDEWRVSRVCLYGKGLVVSGWRKGSDLFTRTMG